MKKIDELVIATNNKNKLEEFRDIFSGSGIRVCSMADKGIHVDPDENGTTLNDNARIKARAVWEECHCPVVGDDTGLFVDALGGEPGVYSARYAGPDGNSGANIDKLLEKLKGVPREERTARFAVSLCYIDAEGNEMIVHGRCEGWIAFERQGEGFGYEPVFCLNNGFSFADIGKELKDRRSHRARAAHILAFYLKGIKKVRGLSNGQQ